MSYAANPGNAFDAAASSDSHKGGYDSLMYWPALEEYYGRSDFVNYGYWDETTHDARQASERLVDKLLDFIPQKKGNILDVACGKGATTRHLLRYYPASAITGVNISAKQLQRCRKNAPGCQFLAMDAVHFAFADRTFDNMICVEAAFHFITRRDFFRNARRVLKPGGRLVLSDLLLTRKGEATRRFGTEKNYIANLAEYEQICLRAGFKHARILDATKPCLEATFWNLVQFSHERLLDRRINADQLRAFTRRFFGFVPHFRYYLLACLTA